MMRWYVVELKEGQSEKVLISRDTYEAAKHVAVALVDVAQDGDAYEIHHDGLIKWGPYIKGGKFKP